MMLTEFKIDWWMNPREKTKMALGNNAVFGKPMKNIRKYRDIKLVTTEARKNYLVSEENYHTTKNFSWKSIINRNNKIADTYELFCLFGPVCTWTE